MDPTSTGNQAGSYSRIRLWGIASLKVAACMLVLFVVGAIIFLPSLGNRPPDVTWRSICKNNLKQIGLALHNYEEIYGCLPPAYIADENGRPIHSWRVLILPQLDHQALYNKYRFDEPWDGPHNRQLHEIVLNIYRCPSDRQQLKSALTNYAVVVGPTTAFPGEQAISFRQIPDGLSNTLLVVEFRNSGVHWMEPSDLSFDQLAPTLNAEIGQAISSAHHGGVDVLLGDASVRFLKDSLPATTLRALLTRNGGETVREF